MSRFGLRPSPVRGSMADRVVRDDTTDLVIDRWDTDDVVVVRNELEMDAYMGNGVWVKAGSCIALTGAAWSELFPDYESLDDYVREGVE